MDPIVREILAELKRKYFKYDEAKFSGVLTVEDFRRVWGREHGGYISPDEIIADAAQEILYPKLVNVTTTIAGVQSVYKCIYIPGCPSNDKKVFKEYVTRGNKILLTEFAGVDTVNICLTPNWGGKSSVLAMALSPIFNGHRAKLTYSVAGDKKKVGLSRTDRGIYYEPSEGRLGISGSVRQLSPRQINVFIGETFSAGELITLALKSISDKIAVTVIGYRSGGATTNIGGKKLSNGGFIEYPLGYMADCRGNIYPDGITPDIEVDSIRME
jgi:hypothetical protein